MAWRKAKVVTLYWYVNLTILILFSGDVDYVVVAQYIEQHSPVYPALEDRIILATTTPSLATSLKTSWTVVGLLLFVYFKIQNCR